MPFALDVATLEDSLGRSLTEPEAAQAQVWADEAAMLLRARIGDLSGLDPQLLQMVVRWAVVDVIKRPDAATEITTSVDDATSTRRYERATGRVTILDEWVDLLTPGGSDSSAFSLRLTSSPWTREWS